MHDRVHPVRQGPPTPPTVGDVGSSHLAPNVLFRVTTARYHHVRRWCANARTDVAYKRRRMAGSLLKTRPTYHIKVRAIAEWRMNTELCKIGAGYMTGEIVAVTSSTVSGAWCFGSRDAHVAMTIVALWPLLILLLSRRDVARGLIAD